MLISGGKYHFFSLADMRYHSCVLEIQLLLERFLYPLIVYVNLFFTLLDAARQRGVGFSKKLHLHSLLRHVQVAASAQNVQKPHFKRASKLAKL